MKNIRRVVTSSFLDIGGFLGCASSDIKPVDLYPEDQCAQCRMAVSNDAFASEIITKDGEVFKFDDLGCQEKFLKEKSGLAIAAMFVKDYQSRTWLSKEKSVIIRTSLKTPMGSGKVAVADSAQARQLREKYPAQDMAETEGCSCCKVGTKN
jgi:copper chaperone NosL